MHMHKAWQFPIHFPLRKFDRQARTAALLTPEERRPDGYLRLWPYLYRFYDADRQPLYLGISSCTAIRLDAHRRQSGWWPLAECIAISAYGTDEAVKAAERAALRQEQPRFNRAGVRGPAYARISLHGAAEDAAAVLFRDASPEFLTALATLLGQPERFPQPVPPPPARFPHEAT